MKSRPLAILSLLTLIFTFIWLVQMVSAVASQPPVITFDIALAQVASQGTNYYVTYLNAALITLFNTALLASLHRFCKPYLPEWAAMSAIIFVPVYCALNLVAYLSQITVISVLIEYYQVEAYRPAAELLLRLTLQSWTQSGVGFFNNLAYAILGIPSIIFAVALYRSGGAVLRWAGVLLALNGVACILGVVGILFKNAALSSGSMVGGALYTFALVLLILGFLKEQPRR